MLTFTEYTDTPVTKFFYYVEKLQKHIDRALVLNLFTVCQRHGLTVPNNLLNKPVILVTGTDEEIHNLSDEYMVFLSDKPFENYTLQDPVSTYSVYGVLEVPDIHHGLILVHLQSNALEVPFRMDERFYIEKDMIANYTEDTPLLTDAGKYFANQLILAKPFGDKIPYINEAFKLGKIDDKVAGLIISNQITRDQYNEYMNNGYWYGFDGTIATATWSEKSITTDPSLPAKRAELLEKYKDKIHDPSVAIALEKQLTDLDRQYLKGDSSEPFYAVTAGKSFGEARKKMYSIFGLGVKFGQGKGAYDFTAHSLEDGWEPQDVARIANDVRRGSYGRSKETAKGGDQTKQVLRMFQDVQMLDKDCGTKRGLTVHLTENNKGFFMNRYLTTGELLTDKNIDNYVGKTVLIRSPMFCESKNNYCAKCCGSLFEKIGTKNIGMQALSVCSTFVSIAMKTMHASSLKTVHLKDIARFFRQPKIQHITGTSSNKK